MPGKRGKIARKGGRKGANAETGAGAAISAAGGAIAGIQGHGYRASERAELFHNHARPCCLGCVEVSGREWPWMRANADEKEMHRWMRTMHHARDKVAISMSKLQEEIDNIRCKRCASYVQVLTAGALPDPCEYRLCEGINLVRHGDKLFLSGQVQHSGLVSMTKIVHEAGTDGNTPALALIMQTTPTHSLVSSHIISWTLMHENPINQYLAQASNLGQQVIKLCQDVEAKMETCGSASEVPRDVRAPCQRADELISMWMSMLSQLVMTVAKLGCCAFTLSPELEVWAFSLTNDLLKLHENALQELSSITARARAEHVRQVTELCPTSIFLGIVQTITPDSARKTVTMCLQKKEIMTRLQIQVHALCSADASSVIEQLSDAWRRWESTMESSMWKELNEVEEIVMRHRLEVFSFVQMHECLRGNVIEEGHVIDNKLKTLLTQWQQSLELKKQVTLDAFQREFSPSVYPQTQSFHSELGELVSAFEAGWSMQHEDNQLKARFSQEEVHKLQLLSRGARNTLEKAQSRRKKVKETEGLLLSSDSDQPLSTQIADLNAQEVEKFLDYRIFHSRNLFLRQWNLRKLSYKLLWLTENQDIVHSCLCGDEGSARQRLSAIIARLLASVLEEGFSMWQAAEVEELVVKEEKLAGRKKSRSQRVANRTESEIVIQFQELQVHDDTNAAEQNATTTGVEAISLSAETTTISPEAQLPAYVASADLFRDDVSDDSTGNHPTVSDEGWTVAGVVKRKPQKEKPPRSYTKSSNTQHSHNHKPGAYAGAQSQRKHVPHHTHKHARGPTNPHLHSRTHTQMSAVAQTVTEKENVSCDHPNLEEESQQKAVECTDATTLISEEEVTPPHIPVPSPIVTNTVVQELATDHLQPKQDPQSPLRNTVSVPVDLGSWDGEDDDDEGLVFGDFGEASTVCEADPEHDLDTNPNSTLDPTLESNSDHHSNPTSNANSKPNATASPRLPDQAHEETPLEQHKDTFQPATVVDAPKKDDVVVAVPVPLAQLQSQHLNTHLHVHTHAHAHVPMMPLPLPAPDIPYVHQHGYMNGYMSSHPMMYSEHPYQAGYPQYFVPPNMYNYAYNNSSGYWYDSNPHPHAHPGYGHNTPPRRGRKGYSHSTQNTASGSGLNRHAQRWQPRDYAHSQSHWNSNPNPRYGRNYRHANTPHSFNPREPENDENDENPIEEQSSIPANEPVSTAPTSDNIIETSMSPITETSIEVTEDTQHMLAPSTLTPPPLDEVMSEVPTPPPGLRNEGGENSCFLNVIVQAFSHLKSFRKLFEPEAVNPNSGMNEDPPNPYPDADTDDAIEGAVELRQSLTAVMRQLHQHTQTQTVLDVRGIRSALNRLSLTHTHIHTYKNGHMSDAAEAYETILQGLSLISPEAASVFALQIQEKAGDKDSSYQSHTLHVRTRTLTEAVHKHTGPGTQPSFAKMLQGLYNSSEWSSVTSRAHKRRHAPSHTSTHESCVWIGLPLPSVLTLTLVWDSLRCTPAALEPVTSCIQFEFPMNEMMTSHTDPDQQADSHAHAHIATLRAMVCFQPHKHHYIAFIRAADASREADAWFCFDDATVTKSGESERDVMTDVVSHESQPYLLFYEIYTHTHS